VLPPRGQKVSRVPAALDFAGGAIALGGHGPQDPTGSLDVESLETGTSTYMQNRTVICSAPTGLGVPWAGRSEFGTGRPDTCKSAVLSRNTGGQRG